MPGGNRPAAPSLRTEGFTANRKLVQRLWREEGLRVPAQRLKRRRLGISTVPAERLVATHRNHVWGLDFLFDTTSDGRPIKVLSMCDEYTRECAGGHVARSITADDVARILDQAAAVRRAPEFIRCDNGPGSGASPQVPSSAARSPLTGPGLPLTNWAVMAWIGGEGHGL